MQSKSLFLTLNLLMMVLSAGVLHAREASEAALAKPYDCPAPILPMEAVRQDMFGDVTLQYIGGPAGGIKDIRIVKSSGYRALDKAAVIALSRCKLAAVDVAAGEPVPARTIDYKFGRQVRVDKPASTQ